MTKQYDVMVCHLRHGRHSLLKMELRFLQNCLIGLEIEKNLQKKGKTVLTQQIYRGKGNLRECSNHRGLETGYCITKN